MAEEIDPKLIPSPKESAQLYSPGRYMIFTKDPSDLTKGYAPEDTRINIVNPPALTDNMRQIWEERYKRKFPDGVKRPGKFPGMYAPRSTEGTLDLKLFDSGFLDWHLTLPQGDEFDEKLDPESMRPFFCIHHLPITVDDHIIYAHRSKQRASWAGTYLFTHSWGEDIDKNYAHDILMRRLFLGQGYELFDQARDGLRREINPFEENENPDAPNKVLDEILKEEDVTIESASCLTMAAMPKDVGYHLCFTAKVNKEAGELIEQRNRYPMVGRIEEYLSTPFTEDNMVRFFEEYKDRIALTVEPTLIMACVQKFGEGFLKKMPYEMRIQRQMK